MSRRAGFTLFEVLTVMALIGILVAIAYPRLRRSQAQVVQSAALQLTRDLESVRSRALGSRRLVRMIFDQPGNRYYWATDVNGDSLFTASDSALAAPGMVGSRSLGDDVTFGRGSMGDVPLYPGVGDIALDSATIVFDDQGLTFPARKQGTVYFASTAGGAAAAVSISAAGSFRVWAVIEGNWR